VANRPPPAAAVQSNATTNPSISAKDASWSLDESTERDRLRYADGVTKLDALDNGKLLVQLPANRYGFVDPQSVLNDDPKRVPIDAAPTGFDQAADFEIHKTSTGELLLVGFVSTDSAGALKGPATALGTQITIYNHGWSAAPQIVSIPVEHLKAPGYDRRVTVDKNRTDVALDVEWK